MELHSSCRAAGHPCSPQHFDAQMLQSAFPDFRTRFDMCFMTIRNPFYRFLSEYNYRRRLWQHNKPRAAQEVFCSFEDWGRGIVRALRNTPSHLGNHLLPQHRFFLPGMRVYRMEHELPRLAADLSRMLKIEPPIHFPHLNRSAGILPSPHYPDALASFVRQYYAADFEMFGYSTVLNHEEPACR